MRNRTTALAVALTRAGVRRPLITVSVALGLIAFFLYLASGLQKEVGYRAYFGPDDELVRQVETFLDEFETGLHLLVVFGCQETPECQRIDDVKTLEFLGRLQSKIEQLPNVARTQSILNTPVAVGELETITAASRDQHDGWSLNSDWRRILERGYDQGFMVGSLISSDRQTGGVLVELQTTESAMLTDVVHGLFDLLPEFEQELGVKIYMGGEPIWNVSIGDMLAHDALILTVGIFVIMFGVLWLLFRDFSLTVIPVAGIGPLVAAVQGITALLGIPLTIMLGTVPILVLVIALTSSIHFLTAFVRHGGQSVDAALLASSDRVGSACFWAAITTAAGFSAFLSSDLRVYRDLGLLAAIGSVLGFVTIFTLLPALLSLRGRMGTWMPAERRRLTAQNVLASTLTAVGRHPLLVLAVSLGAFGTMTAGVSKLYYARDVGFGDHSYVIRSARFIEANLRKAETIDASVVVPAGSRIYDPGTLQLLVDLENALEGDALTGRAWSFVDFLEYAYQVDHGRPPDSIEAVIADAQRLMPLLANTPLLRTFWSETTVEESPGNIRQFDKARVSAEKGWSGAEPQAFVARMRAATDQVKQRYEPLGYKIELEGGTMLLDEVFIRLQDTQRRSLVLAFIVATLTLAALLWRDGLSLVFWAMLVNVLPVLSVLGLMGWLGTGIDPANAMVAAILLVVVVDDTIHFSLRFRSERRKGATVPAALEATFLHVGEAIVTSTFCLSLGFCVFLAAEWGGLIFFGFIAALGVLLALVGDLLLLPSALLVTTRRGAQSETTNP